MNIKQRNGCVAVLMYHAIETEPFDSGYTKAGDRIYVVSSAAFRRQLEYLSSHGYKTCLPEDYWNIDEHSEKRVIITFDDGHASNFLVALPILREFGYIAQFFITTNYIGTPRFLERSAIKELYEYGMGIGSHGVSHRFLSDLEVKDRNTEFLKSKSILEEIVGERVRSLSAPGGRLDRVCADAALNIGYEFIFGSKPGLVCRRVSEPVLGRYAIKNNTSLGEFKRIVSRKESELSMKSLKSAFLDTAKWALGNTRYERARENALELFKK